MKRIFSVILCLTMLVTSVTFTAVSAGDTCIRLTDTTGSSGYSAGSDTVNAAVSADGGVTLIFDVLVESFTEPSDGWFSQIVAFTGGAEYNFAGYNLAESAFTAGVGNEWVASTQTTYTRLATRDYSLETGRWYELAFQFNGNEATVYLDGVPMIAAEYNSAVLDYVILYPQFCTILIDNIRVCGKDYNVTDRYGEVIAVEDFNDSTALNDSDAWFFAEGVGYSLYDGGRAMPELVEYLPARTVSPEITGAYLKYAESAGSGVVSLGKDLTPYRGFTVVQDIRVDRKSIGSHIAVRFGTNYIAGYDFNTGCFRIAQRSGFGFSSTAVFATTTYSLELGETYEIAVRQYGDAVSVYLNGVLMASAQNFAFDTGYNSVQISNYRLNASIDNMVIAYPDYNVREADGSVFARLSFEENTDYINSKCKLELGGTTYGYSIAVADDAPAVTVDSVESAEGSATVGIALSGCSDFSAYTLYVAYPETFTVTNAVVSDTVVGYADVSPLTENPIKMLCLSDTAVADGKVLTVTFTVPDKEGEYPVTATLVPTVGDVDGREITGTGTVSVPAPGLIEGQPDSVTYDGEYLTWSAVDGAIMYDICMTHPDGYEEYIDCVEELEYELYLEDYIYNEGVYEFRVYAYNEDVAIFAVSVPYTVSCDADGNITPVAPEEDDTETVLPGDVNGDGTVTISDSQLLSRILAGAKITASMGADYNGDGIVTIVDAQYLTRRLAGAKV